MTKLKLSIEMKKYKDIRSSDIKDRIKETAKIIKVFNLVANWILDWIW